MRVHGATNRSCSSRPGMACKNHNVSLDHDTLHFRPFLREHCLIDLECGIDVVAVAADSRWYALAKKRIAIFVCEAVIAVRKS